MNGVPILQSLKIAKDSAGNEILAEHTGQEVESSVVHETQFLSRKVGTEAVVGAVTEDRERLRVAREVERVGIRKNAALTKRSKN